MYKHNNKIDSSDKVGKEVTVHFNNQANTFGSHVIFPIQEVCVVGSERLVLR